MARRLARCRRPSTAPAVHSTIRGPCTGNGARPVDGHRREPEVRHGRDERAVGQRPARLVQRGEVGDPQQFGDIDALRGEAAAQHVVARRHDLDADTTQVGVHVARRRGRSPRPARAARSSAAATRRRRCRPGSRARRGSPHATRRRAGASRASRRARRSRAARRAGRRRGSPARSTVRPAQHRRDRRQPDRVEQLGARPTARGTRTAPRTASARTAVRACGSRRCSSDRPPRTPPAPARATGAPGSTTACRRRESSAGTAVSRRTARRRESPSSPTGSPAITASSVVPERGHARPGHRRDRRTTAPRPAPGDGIPSNAGMAVCEPQA